MTIFILEKWDVWCSAEHLLLFQELVQVLIELMVLLVLNYMKVNWKAIKYSVDMSPARTLFSLIVTMFEYQPHKDFQQKAILGLYNR